jgi:hypothetical protein
MWLLLMTLQMKYDIDEANRTIDLYIKREIKINLILSFTDVEQ